MDLKSVEELSRNRKLKGQEHKSFTLGKQLARKHMLRHIKSLDPNFRLTIKLHEHELSALVEKRGKLGAIHKSLVFGGYLNHINHQKTVTRTMENIMMRNWSKNI